MNKILPPSILPDIFSKDLGEKKTLPLYNVCFLGHVDAGKSTTVSQLLVSDKRVSDHLIKQFEKEAGTMGKGSFKFAWLLDQQKEQRARGITIQIAHVEFGTKNRYFTIIDAPGHKDFTKNAITGTSQADLAVLVVDSKKGLLEAAQTEEHAIIARASGVTSIIVALTKIDTLPAQDRQKIILERMQEVSVLLANCGFSPENTIMVPVDSYNNVNVTTSEKNAQVIPFYKGPTLSEALDTIGLPENNETLPFRLSIEDICTKIGGTNCVVTGKVMSGIVRPNDAIVVKPSNKKGKVGSIQMHHKDIAYAPAGANVGIDLKGITPEDVSKASIVCHLEDRPAKAVEEFTVEKAVIRKHPTRIALNSNLIIHYQTGSVCAKVKSLSNVYSISEKKWTMGPVQFVKAGSLVDITLIPDRPIVVESKEHHPRNSRVMFREQNQTIGWGSVSSVKISRFEI